MRGVVIDHISTILIVWSSFFWQIIIKLNITPIIRSMMISMPDIFIAVNSFPPKSLPITQSSLFFKVSICLFSIAVSSFLCLFPSTKTDIACVLLDFICLKDESSVYDHHLEFCVVTGM